MNSKYVYMCEHTISSVLPHQSIHMTVKEKNKTLEHTLEYATFNKEKGVGKGVSFALR
jgi:hypothetical protein